MISQFLVVGKSKLTLGLPIWRPGAIATEGRCCAILPFYRSILKSWSTVELFLRWKSRVWPRPFMFDNCAWLYIMAALLGLLEIPSTKIFGPEPPS